jgi:hypothetical protein
MTTGKRSIFNLIEDEFHTSFLERENPEGTSVGTTSALMLRSNANRVAFYLINLSVNTIYVRPTLAASSSEGIFVAGNGGFFITNWRDDFTLPSKDWHIVASGAGSNYYLIEIIAI